jgi:hypothetical protein
MRLPLRSFGTLLLAIGVATCSDSPHAVVKTAPEGQAGIGRFSISPRFSPQAAAVYAQRATFAAASFDHVHIVLTRPPNEIVIDTIITFNPASPPTTLDLFVDVKTTNEVFDGAIQYTNSGAVVYQASGKIQSYPPDQVAPTPQELVVVYVGPGANATRLIVSPKTSTVVAPGGTSLTATAFDANNAPVANAPITWSVSDASVATLSTTTGTSTSITTAGKRGTVTVTAATPTLSDNATVTVSLPPTGIVLVSGGGQTGKAGNTLSAPGVVRVTASDGVGVAGVSVQFAAPSGGSVGSASVTTDAQGQASSSLTLGGTVGAQSFAASASGFSVSIPATAIPGDPSTLTLVSGSGQTDTVGRALKAPFVVKVSDRFGNGVGNVTVTWAKTSGGGTLAGTSSLSAADGTARMGYTLGATPGPETVTATAAGVASSVTFSANAITGPANIVAVSGSGQTGRVGQALGAPLVVKVTDAAGTPVSGAVVLWSATNGSIGGGGSTDAQGQASATFTLGTTVGAASATASVNTSSGVRTATFSATVQAGTVARASFRVGPTTVGVGSVMVPSVQVELQDAGGNRTNAVNAVSIAIGTNPGQATLGGTLTRNAVAGVATFDDLTLSAIGTGFTLVASSAGVPSVASAAFDVTGVSTSPRILFVDAQTLAPITGQASVTMTAGVAPTNAPSIRLLDPQGAPMANTTVPYTVTRGAQTLFGGAPQTNAQGVITFATLSISPANMQVAGTYTFTATLSGATGSPLSLPVTVLPDVPAKYVLSASTTTPAASGTSNITAQLADQYNNPISQSQRTVNWTFSGVGNLSSAGSPTNASGQAVNVYTAPANPTGTVLITATDAATPSITGQITLTPQAAPTGPAAKLAIVTQPSALATSLVALAQQPVIQVVDANNNPVATPVPLQVSAVWNAPGGSERNSLAQTNAAGVATFTSLAVVGGGTGTISFNSPPLTGVSSIPVTSVVPPTAVAFLVQPTTTVQNGAIAPAVQVRVVDGNNNTVTTSTQRITLAIGSNPGNGVLSGTISLNAVNGIATFPGINIDAPGTGYTLTALATGLTSATSTPFDILPVPNALAITAFPTTAINDVPFSPPVTVRLMQSGNPLLLAGVTVTATDVFSLSSRPPAANSRAGRASQRRGGATRSASMAMPPNVLSNNTAVTDANGVATFTGMKLTGNVQYFRLAFDAQGPGFAITDTTSDIFLDAGSATSMLILSGDAQSGQTGQPLSIDPTVALVDISGNFTTGPATTVTFATSTGSVNPTSAVTDQSGFASTRWTMPATIGSATMTASATINGSLATLTFSATSVASTPASSVYLSPQTAVTPVGTPLPAASYPKMQFLDQTGAPVPNYNITLSTSGACALTGGQSVVVPTDSQGQITLTSSTLTFSSATPQSCYVFGVPAAPGFGFAQFSLIAVPTNMKSFIGTASRNWTDPANWYNNSLPTATDAVFVPGFILNGGGVIQSNSSIGSLTMESGLGQNLTLSSNVLLTVNGSIDGGANGAIQANVGNNAAVVLNATGSATVSGIINSAVRFGQNAPGCTTTYTLASSFVQVFNPTVNCPLDLGANALNVAGALTVQGAGRIIMTQPQAVLIVGSDATFQGASEAGFLTEGAISINGQLRINAVQSTTPFVQGPNATLQLTNSTSGIVAGANVQAFTVGALQIPGTPNAIISSPNPITATSLLQAGGMTISAGTTFNVTGSSFFQTGSTTTINGFSTLGGTVDFAGTASVTGSGSLSVTTPSTCSKKSTATVNVTGTTPAFTASAAQCSNQIP